VSADYCPTTGKISYSRRGAGEAARAFFVRKADGQKLYPYRCKRCLRWHIGRTEPTTMRRRQERDWRRTGSE